VDSTALALLHRLVAEVGALRREVADQNLEILELLGRLEPARPAMPDAEPLVRAIHRQFGEREFLALELLDWCRPCLNDGQRTAYRGLCAMCGDEDPTPRQAGMALAQIASAAPCGPLRLSRCGERRKTALWGVGPAVPH
jgi:hypothetical protein